MGNEEELEWYKRQMHIQNTVMFLRIFFWFICWKIEVKLEALFQNLNKPHNISLTLSAAKRQENTELFHSEFPAMTRN